MVQKAGSHAHLPTTGQGRSQREEGGVGAR
jgi:hypothetical protein